MRELIGAPRAAPHRRSSCTIATRSHSTAIMRGVAPASQMGISGLAPWLSSTWLRLGSGTGSGLGLPPPRQEQSSAQAHLRDAFVPTITSETKRRVCSTLQTSDAAVARSTATEIMVDSKAQGYWERYWAAAGCTAAWSTA